MTTECGGTRPADGSQSPSPSSPTSRTRSTAIAIAYQRTLHRKADTASQLKAVKGIGDVKLKKLLSRWPTKPKLKAASAEELKEELKINDETVRAPDGEDRGAVRDFFDYFLGAPRTLRFKWQSCGQLRKYGN